jgi:hypothetical protein
MLLAALYRSLFRSTFPPGLTGLAYGAVQPSHDPIPKRMARICGQTPSPCGPWGLDRQMTGTNQQRARRVDLIGWLSLLVVIPFFWLGAPVVLLVNGLRVRSFLQSDRDIPSPTIAATLASSVLCCFWVYYVVRLLDGASAY